MFAIYGSNLCLIIYLHTYAYLNNYLHIYVYLDNIAYLFINRAITKISLS